jgi:hypothetical protein
MDGRYLHTYPCKYMCVCVFNKKRGSERERKGDKDREREGAVLTRQRSGQRLGIWNTNPGFESRLEFKVL